MYDISSYSRLLLGRPLLDAAASAAVIVGRSWQEGGTAARTLTGAAASCCLKELTISRKQPARAIGRARAAFPFYKRVGMS